MKLANFHRMAMLACHYAQAYIDGKDAPAGVLGAYELHALAKSIADDPWLDIKIYRDESRKSSGFIFRSETMGAIPDLFATLERIGRADCGCEPICACDESVESLRAWKESVIELARSAIARNKLP